MERSFFSAPGIMAGGGGTERSLVVGGENVIGEHATPPG
jgi:hypothetical protein